MRRDVTILGKFCLNINNIPQLAESPNLNQENTGLPCAKPEKDTRNYAVCFYNALKQILTTVSFGIHNLVLYFPVHTFGNILMFRRK